MRTLESTGHTGITDVVFAEGEREKEEQLVMLPGRDKRCRLLCAGIHADLCV